MVASLLERNPIDEQLLSLTALVEQLQQEVGELRRENAQLRQQVSELRCDVGYWKSRHSDALQRNVILQGELDQARAEIRQLKAERFGKQSEKQSSTDRSNDLDDPQEQPNAKKRRGQQPGRPVPKRRDYAHLPPREEQVDVSQDDKVCACCGKPLTDLGHSPEERAISGGCGCLPAKTQWFMSLIPHAVTMCLSRISPTTCKVS